MAVHVRSLALVLAVAAVTLSGSALGAPKPVCKIVVDATADENTLTSGNLDITSADVATKGKKITAVIRLAKLSASDLTAPGGAAYTFRFMTPGVDTPFYLQGTTHTGTPQFFFGYFDTANIAYPLGAATGVFDYAKSEVRITSSTTFGKQVFKPNQFLTTMIVFAQRRVQDRPIASDRAVGDRNYIVGTPSCVVVGK